MSSTHYVALPDSSRVPLGGARVIGPAHSQTPLTVTVYLRRAPDAPARPDVYQLALQAPTRRSLPTDDQYAAAHRWLDSDLRAVEDFAALHDLKVDNPDPMARSIQLTGTTQDVADAFRVTLARYRYQDAGGNPRTYRGREGQIYLPAELDGIVTGVFGLDDRPIGARLLIRRAADTVPVAHAAPTVRPGAFLPPQLQAPYAYPAGTDGSGQCIAVLAFNGETPPGIPSGGYSLKALRNYFVNVLHQDMPDITNVVIPGVGTPGNEPGQDADFETADTSGEIMLDLAIVGALAPKAKIVVYFSAFTEQGWVDVITRIVNDTENRPTVISSSYGNLEAVPGGRWTAGAMKRVDAAFANAAEKNISICCASGDDGSRDQADDERAHADFPASSPHVLGIGGTSLVVDHGKVVSEVCWDDGPGSRTGGGISKVFPVPPFQAAVHVPPSVNPPHGHGRGVPDVSGLADPRTGVVIPSVDGVHFNQIGGTSASAPMWSALLARINQGLPGSAQVGFLNPLLYAKFATGVLRDVTQGSNGAYASGPGWDPCTGLGSIDGQRLLDGLKAL
ncbi:putative serine protease [Kitasatospora sp. Ki12]|uniref:S53 family peptidase n=1 Tax=Kitasatospora xanthocidica TaxID=83382 RepID=UPI001675F082|nr:S53 family peptidase [Kitasatospora xanthocidica]GHF83506.1 kumamolisin [Kitasatospora xanthocidica]